MLQFVFSDNEEECNWIIFAILKEQIQAKNEMFEGKWRQICSNGY